MLCHTLNTAPGTAAIGWAAKWLTASELAKPEFCIPTSIDMAAHLLSGRRIALPMAKPSVRPRAL